MARETELCDRTKAAIRAMERRLGILKTELEELKAGNGDERSIQSLSRQIAMGERYVSLVSDGTRGAMSQIAREEGVSRAYVSAQLSYITKYRQNFARGTSIAGSVTVRIPADVETHIGTGADGTLDQDAARRALDRALETAMKPLYGAPRTWLYLTTSQMDLLDEIRERLGSTRADVLLAVLLRGLLRRRHATRAQQTDSVVAHNCQTAVRLPMVMQQELTAFGEIDQAEVRRVLDLGLEVIRAAKTSQIICERTGLYLTRDQIEQVNALRDDVSRPKAVMALLIADVLRDSLDASDGVV